MADYIIRNGELYHHGVIGMKWGRRRYQNKDGTLTAAGKKRYDKEMEKLKAEQKVLKNRERTQAKIDKLNAMQKDVDDRKSKLDGPNKAEKVKQTAKAVKDAKKRTIKDLSDAELQAKVDRLQLEKRYRDLMKEAKPPQSNKGKTFVTGILEQSSKNIGTQLSTYVMGKGVNALLRDVFKDESVVNPQKGQKDK